MSQARCAKPRLRGFSIVELLVATAVTAMLLGGVIAIFMSSRASFATTDRLSQIQESGRHALDELVNGIRAAGFAGCARTPAQVSSSLNGTDDPIWNFRDSPVRGYRSIGTREWNPQLDALNAPNGVAGSDVLLLRRPRPGAEPSRLKENMESEVDALVVHRTANPGLRPGDVAMIYTCEAQAYFFVSSFADGVIMHTAESSSAEPPGNVVDSLGYAFRADAEVIPIETVLYYVATDATGVPSLWRSIGTDPQQEVARGVEQMQLRFGVDLDADSVVDEYVTANAVTNWDSVLSVAVALLVRSLDSTLPDDEAASLQPPDVSAPGSSDGHIRETFTALAGIRNRASVN